jgi:transcriptional regulator with GAF, ATPase, and Fis domain
MSTAKDRVRSTVRLSHAERRERRKKISATVRRTGDVEAAARAFGVTLTTVRDACREHGVVIPERRA